jgi:hypothetical protein
LRLNLLDSPFAEHDLNHLGKLQISVEDAKDDVHTDSSLADQHVICAASCWKPTA